MVIDRPKGLPSVEALTEYRQKTLEESREVLKRLCLRPLQGLQDAVNYHRLSNR